MDCALSYSRSFVCVCVIFCIFWNICISGVKPGDYCCTRKIKDDRRDSNKIWSTEKRPVLSRYSSVTEIHSSLFKFLLENFNRKECMKFESAPQQTNCLCGGTLKEHKLLNFSDSFLPGSVDQEKAYNASNGPRLKTYPTNAYGKIEFQIDGIGLLKPSKYLRLSDDSNLDSLVTLLQEYWKMNEPNPPQFIMSVIGNTSSFIDNPTWKEQFSCALLKAILTANAWLFTGALNFGVVKAVGDAVRKRQSLVSTKDRMIHAIRCIGVAKWGCVENSDLLINSDPQEMHYARYKVKPHHKMESGRAFLNPGHTHFLLVDDGSKRMCKGTEIFRVELMHKISAAKKDEGLEIPSMLLVLGGELDSVDEVLLCLQKDIPVLLCCGTGDIADIIATAISCASSSSSKCERMCAEEDKDLIKTMLSNKYKKNFKNTPQLLESKTKDIHKCCRKKHLIHIFDIHGHEGLDSHILHTVIRHKKEATLQDQLLLAVKWDRPDVAKKLFPDCGSWPLNIMEEAMTAALITNKPSFVKLFLKRGIVMRDYLTVGILRMLYNESISENEAAITLIKDLTHKSKFFNLRDITSFLSSLLRKHRHELYSRDITCKRGTEPTGISGEHFEQPFRELFIWAVMVLRTDMALLFWNETQKPLLMSVVATAIYWRLNVCYENEEQSIYIDKKKEFERIAIGVVQECDKMDWKKTLEILNYRDSYWGNMTLLDLAIMGYDRSFMSTPTCIKVTEQLWFGKLETNTILRLSITIFNPLLIGLGYIRFRIDHEVAREPNIFEKIYYFYTCPAIKMIVLFYSYLCYLILFSYVILFDFREVMDWPEIVLHMWVFSLILDIGKEIVQQPSDSKDSKVMEWFYGYFWNKLDAVWVALFTLGFIFRLTTQFTDKLFWLRLDDVHLVYTFSCLLSYIRLYEFYMTMSHIGPKLIVLKRMIGDLVVFFLIVAVCILCYGIGRVALLHRERQPFWSVFREIVSLPYWHLFGELDVGEYGEGAFPKCELDPSSCFQSSHAWLVPIMLGIYMLIGNILLVNMLIAVFTHVFDEVNANSREIYLYEIYISGLQFSRRSVLTPPFLIIEDLLFAAYFVCLKLYQKIYAKCCCLRDRCNKKCEMQLKLYRVYVNNLRLFEKEARSKYLKTMTQYDDHIIEGTNNESWMGNVKDLIKKIQAHYGSKGLFQEVKMSARGKDKDISNRLTGKSHSAPSNSSIKSEDEEREHMSEHADILKLSEIKGQIIEQKIAMSCAETEERFSQIKHFLSEVVYKLENIDKNLMKLTENSSPWINE